MTANEHPVPLAVYGNHLRTCAWWACRRCELHEDAVEHDDDMEGWHAFEAGSCSCGFTKALERDAAARANGRGPLIQEHPFSPHEAPEHAHLCWRCGAPRERHAA